MKGICIRHSLRFRHTLPAFLGAILITTSALADVSPDLRAELIRRAAEKGLTADQTKMILDRIDRIAASDLPAAVVLDRYLEGLSKDVPLERITAVIDQLESRLRNSAGWVDEVYGPAFRDRSAPVRLALIDNCAYATAVGVTSDGIVQMMHLAADAHQAPEEGKSAVLAVGCLVGSGLSQSASCDLVRMAWQHGFRGTDLERLGRDVGGLKPDEKGQPPEQVVQRLMDSIRAGAPPQEIFHDLDILRGADSPGPGEHPPGTRPGEDPSERRGPGGPPADPGHMGSGSRNPPHHEGMH